MKTPKAVFLDVGWTLTYPSKSMWQIFAAVCREAGSDRTAGDIEKGVHEFLTSRRSEAIREFEAGAEYPDSDADFLSIFLGMGRLVFGFAGLESENHEALAGRFLELFWDRTNWAVFPDVLPAIERLRSRGIRVGVISNASSELVEFLKQIDLFPSFDFVCVSAIEGIRKPDRRIYQRALERAAVAPSEAVHVGDMFLEDVLGPRKNGIRPFLMDRGPRSMFPHHPEAVDPVRQPAIEIVHALDEVLEALGIH